MFTMYKVKAKPMSGHSRFWTVFCIGIFLCMACGGFCEEWQRVYLATYPRSGNHWMRHLIEEATHIATSSVHADPDKGHVHLQEVFAWKGYCADHGYDRTCRYPTPGDIVVVKTHYPAQAAMPGDELPFVRAVHMVRHPVDALYSYYVYTQNGRPSLPIMPRQTLMGFICELRRFEAYWERQENVLTVRYEDLMADLHGVLKSVLAFIGYTVSEEDMRRAVAAHPPQGEPLKHLSLYPQEDLDYIAVELKEFMEKYHYE